MSTPKFQFPKDMQYCVDCETTTGELFVDPETDGAICYTCAEKYQNYDVMLGHVQQIKVGTKKKSNTAKLLMAKDGAGESSVLLLITKTNLKKHQIDIQKTSAIIQGKITQAGFSERVSNYVKEFWPGWHYICCASRDEAGSKYVDKAATQLGKEAQAKDIHTNFINSCGFGMAKIGEVKPIINIKVETSGFVNMKAALDKLSTSMLGAAESMTNFKHPHIIVPKFFTETLKLKYDGEEDLVPDSGDKTTFNDDKTGEIYAPKKRRIKL